MTTGVPGQMYFYVLGADTYAWEESLGDFTGEKKAGFSTRICLVSPLGTGAKSEERPRADISTR